MNGIVVGNLDVVVVVVVVVDEDEYEYDTGKGENFCLRKEVCLDFDFP